MITINPALMPVPQVVDMAQARMELIATGKIAQVDALLAAIPGVDGDIARAEWDYRQTVRRDSPLVQHLISTLGWSASEVDAMFISAAKR